MSSATFQAMKEKAASKIMDQWKAYKKSGATKDLSGLVRIKQADELGKTQGSIKISTEVQCGLCKEKTAIRFCQQCPKSDLQYFCIECFRTFHSKGARKRHERMRIIYKGQEEDANMSPDKR